MKPVRITPTTIKFNKFGCVGAFLVEDQDGLTLIDTTLKSGGAEIVRYLSNQSAPLRRVVLTHAHVDHVGGLDAVTKAFPDAEVSMSEREHEIYLLAREGVGTAKMPVHADEPQVPLKGKFTACKTEVGRRLVNGEKVGSLRVIATPGHTPGHISLLDERDGSLFVGDAMTNLDKLRSSGDYSLLNPLGKLVTWSAELALTSVRLLADLAPTAVYVAHGKPVSLNVASTLESAIRSAERRVAKR